MFPFLLAAAAVPLNPPATFMNGNELYDLCRQGSPQCGAYILGVVDAVSGFSASMGHPFYCIPTAARGDRVRDVAVRELMAHPEQRHLAAAAIILGAVAQAFPCKS